jgi:hypothetical protein
MKPPPASGRTRLAIYGMYTRTLSVCPATCKLVIWMLNNLRLCLDADACSFFSSLASGLHEWQVYTWWGRWGSERRAESLVDEGKRSRLVGRGPEARISLFKPEILLHRSLLVELNSSGKRKLSMQWIQIL